MSALIDSSPARGQVDTLAGASRSEIRTPTADPARDNHWRGESNLPDFSHVEDQLRALAERGYADTVLQLGEELRTRANKQVEQSDGDKVYSRNHRLEDWQAPLEGLRRRHKAKRRLIRMLDTLSTNKLVD